MRPEPCPTNKKGIHYYEKVYRGDNQPNNLYCRYCGSIIPSNANDVAASLDNLNPQEIKRRVNDDGKDQDGTGV